MFADVHNHTCHYSPDAQMTIDELIEAASKRGLAAVGVTEHFEYDNPDTEDNIGTFDISRYSIGFDTWRAKCPASLKLLMGIEFGYQTHTASSIDRFAISAPFDVVILSNHLFHGHDVYYGGEECYGMPKTQRHAEYIGILAEMCERCDNYDIAAHFDYINRYNPDPEEYLLYEDCPKEFDRFLEAVVSKNKCLEINTRSVYKAQGKGSSVIMPDAAIIRRYLDMGGKLISLGSDSHTPDTLGIMFEETASYLKSLGVNELCWFEKRSPVMYGI